MRLVYISSPLRGDMEKNMEKAKDYCAYAASCGVIPLAPHTIFTQYLNDAVPEQREQGLRMGHELLERCDELWVMGDTISQGMKDEIGLATFLQLPILYVSDDMVKNQKMIRQSDRPLDINDCIPESSQYNYENQFLVLKPGVSSKGKDMTADDSIWYARNGFGCIYGARGQAVYERAKAEFDARMEELAALPPKEILDHAYEKIIKEDFLCHLEEGLDEWETDALLSYPQPLAALYTEWMGVDYSYLDIDRIQSTAKQAAGKRLNELRRHEFDVNGEPPAELRYFYDLHSEILDNPDLEWVGDMEP